jgi:hypothetical protein
MSYFGIKINGINHPKNEVKSGIPAYVTHNNQNPTAPALALCQSTPSHLCFNHVTKKSDPDT